MNDNNHENGVHIYVSMVKDYHNVTLKCRSVNI